MNGGRAGLLSKLSSGVLLLALVCAVWLVAQHWTKVRPAGTVRLDPGNPVAARSGSRNPDNTKPRESVVGDSKQTSAPVENPKTVSAPVQAASKALPAAPTPRERAASNERTVRLADGRELTFAGFTYGLDHKYIQDKSSAKPQVDTAPRREVPGMRTISIKTDSPSLVVWLHCRAAQGSFLEADFISLVDEGGREGELTNPSSIFNPAQFETVGAWQISNFPRRDPVIGIRFYSRDGSYKFHRLAEFWSANPAPQKYPTWSAEPGPIVKRMGNIEYRFLNFFVGEPRYGSEQGPIHPNEWTTFVFKVSEKNRSEARWKIESVALSDATGNIYAPDKTRFNIVGDFLLFSCNRVFWSSEAVGKLKAEFNRTAGFPAGELVTFTNLRVPTGTNRVTVSSQKKIGEGALQVEQLVRHMFPVHMADAYWNMELTAALAPEAPGVHVSVAEISDQTGRKFPTGITHKLGQDHQSFLFDIPAQSETLNITFAVQRSQFVEFLADLRNETALETQRKPGTGLEPINQASLIGR